MWKNQQLNKWIVHKKEGTKNKITTSTKPIRELMWKKKKLKVQNASPFNGGRRAQQTMKDGVPSCGSQICQKKKKGEKKKVDENKQLCAIKSSF